ncbi:hypothetical protein [Pseudomonas aeruginosa]|uniref:hypothetical protein n=1 Tax=Pseudomonas aeruginosa TaxID=287 RepID=UPI000F546D9D|nr:hypothetical protein [Pseudomonas aeruginosa]MDX3947565.1 hypothetical protein [Pseudomonas aeruginosa]RQB97293.1 hypothetical protein IPC404_29255 [Pseudomonas aeruginosa]
MDEPLFNELLESVKQADQIMTDHAELRRLAEEVIRIERNEDEPISAAWGLFDSAANPKTILALLDEIDGLSDELSACTEHPGGCGYWREAAKRRAEERDRLKAENEALLMGMRAILNAYDYADQYNKEGVAVEVMEDLRTLFKGATQ